MVVGREKAELEAANAPKPANTTATELLSGTADDSNLSGDHLAGLWATENAGWRADSLNRWVNRLSGFQAGQGVLSRSTWQWKVW